MRVRDYVVYFFASMFLFGLLSFVFFAYLGAPFSWDVLTGYVVEDDGIVQVFIDTPYNIVIYSPENITYNFSKGDSYLIPLNVSADFSVDEWRYFLYDITHDVYVESNTVFVPNSSISAVRWGNLLTVSAHNTDGEWHNKSVVFFVNVSNSAPILGNFSDPIFVCEGEALSYGFNASDLDEDDLTGHIYPLDPFWTEFISKNLTMNYFNIVSGVLTKGNIGIHSENVSVFDPDDLSDTKNISVDVIEINNVPVLENLGAQTVYLKGKNSSFYRVSEVYDVEDGVTNEGNLTFNLTWGTGANLFDIGHNNGVMNYSPIVGEEGVVYDLTLCVEDNALSSIHPNISLCFPRDGDKESSCDTFSLTVTNDNRAPEILNYTPVDNVFAVGGLHNVKYNVFVYDKDGTIPDIDWYVDGIRLEHNENLSSDVFNYAFACEVSGAHTVKIITTDGLLNDSQTWFVDVASVECPIESSGGGGGSMDPNYCIENWVCDDWNVCQNVKKSFESELLSLEDYSVAKAACSQNMEEDERFCGFDIRTCYDLNACDKKDSILSKPDEKGFCYFTENPSCSDEITNCHDGGCELLADCGGPCGPCPNCNDGKQNQGENDVDCGGPCPFECEPETPFAVLSSILIVLAIALVILILWILWSLFLLWKRWNKDDKKK